MEHLRVLQFNADRGKQATDLGECFFLDGCDVALIQEPYVKFQAKNTFQRLKLYGTNYTVKAEIWARNNLDVTVMLQDTTENYVILKLNSSEPGLYNFTSL